MKTLKLVLFVFFISCASTGKLSETDIELIQKNQSGQGINFQIEFRKGKAHNHPSFAFWIEDMDGNYIQTLFVTQFVATGIYAHGQLAPGKWSNTPGYAERPASLPYWLHKRNILNNKGNLLPTPDMPVPDAYTAATPKSDFTLKTKADNELPKRFKLIMEINQPWDSNAFWNNAKYPDNWDYLTSLQPALIYGTNIDLTSNVKEFMLELLGHSHWSGENGELYSDITSITTAINIIKQVVVVIQ